MNKKQILCFLLAMIMVFGMLPLHSFAVNTDGEERVPMDYVLVVDVSDTMDSAAPGTVCASACDLFMDLLPYRNVRVGVIAYGYNGSNSDLYPYSDEFKVTFEDEYVHLIADMQESSTAMSREDIMEKLVAAYRKDGSKSTHGQALMAAVDMLNRSNARKGQASIILMTDGELATQDWLTTDNYKKTAVQEAKNNDWPIYTIELDFKGKHSDIGNVDLAKLESSSYHGMTSYSRALTSEIAYDTGARKYPLTADGKIDKNAEPELGTWVISSENKNSRELINKIHLAFMQILNGKITTTDSVNGDIVVDCHIPNLTCEYVLGVTAVGLESISVQKPGEAEAVNYTISNDDDRTQIIEKGNQHFTVRLFCPTPGDWKITAHFVEDVKATVYEDLTTDVEITMDGMASYAGASTALTAGEIAQLDKRGEISINAELSYHSDRMYLDPNAGDTKAFLEVYLDADDTLSKLCVKEMEITEDGFVLESAQLSDLIGGDLNRIGSYAVQIRMENDRLPEKYTYSNLLRFRADDIGAEFLSDELDPVSGDVFSQCQVDLTNHLKNADGDELKFELIHTDDSVTDVCFENGLKEITGDLNNLTIQTGAHADVHDLVLQVTDFKKVHQYALELTVTNNPPTPADKKIDMTLYYGEVSPWFDSVLMVMGKIFPSLESWFRGVLTADGESDYLLALEDPDGQTLEYEVVDPGKSVEGELVCKIVQDESGLSIKPNKEGDTTLELLVYDGTYVKDDSGAYVKAAFPRTLKVHVESVQNNLMEFLLALLIFVIVALVITVVTIVLIRSNRKIRGTWTVEIKLGGNEPLTCSSRVLQGARKTNVPEVVVAAVNTLKSSGDSVTKMMLEEEKKEALEEMVKCWFKKNDKNQYGTGRSRNIESIRLCGVCIKGRAMKVKNIVKDPKCKIRRRSGSIGDVRTLKLNRGDQISFCLSGDVECTITLKNK